MKSRRVITFVPADQADSFAAAIAEHIPYLFGDYDSVCWWSKPKTEQGTEQFRQKNSELQQVASVRMEFSIPDEDRAYNDFVDKLSELHPWEQPVLLSFNSDIAAV